MIWYLFMFMLSNALYVEGGNITQLFLVGNVSSDYWVGLIGKVSYQSFSSPLYVFLNESGVYFLNITLSPTCNPISPYLFFSNSSRLYFPLRSGNISYLQLVVNGTEGANNTLLNNTTVIFPFIGTLWNVPYVATRTMSDKAYVYFLQDRVGNVVFVAPIKSMLAYNGMNVDYQVMLPLLNRSPTNYTIFFYYSCLSYNNTTYYSSSGGVPYFPPKPPEQSPEKVYFKPSCTYYVSGCVQDGKVLICEMEGCGDREEIILPLEEIGNVVDIKKVPIAQLSYKKSIKQVQYTYVFPTLIVILTAALALTTLFVVITTLPSLGLQLPLLSKRDWERK